MREPKTLYQFIKRCRKFSETNGITSILKVDKVNTIEDLDEAFNTQVGGIIADIDNGVSEAIEIAIRHYDKTGNTKMIEAFKKLRN